MNIKVGLMCSWLNVHYRSYGADNGINLIWDADPKRREVVQSYFR